MKNIKIKLKVIHLIAGRARIKIDSGFDPKVFFYVLEAGLREIREIKKADLNPYSQSITVFFRNDVDIEVILKEMRRFLEDMADDPEFPDRMEDIKDALAHGDKAGMNVVVRDKILNVSNNLDQAVRHMSGNTVDMRTAVPISSVATGIAALVLAPTWATPAWLVLLTFGITSFHLLKHDHGQTTAPVDPSLPEPGRAVPVKHIEALPSGLPETG
ncbi:MAG: hypothetical protein B6240_00065 [Desulfobacteraceae bacterium 4572_87]|nr:MAG: hypothetical protein B6240_00065 [Desulfobacteraceae bacterium 4572_87]